MSFNLPWARKTHRFDSVNDTVPGNHLSYRIHRYRYVRVDTRKISLENNPVAHITAPGTSQEVNRTQRSDNLPWARKTHRFDSVNDTVPGNHLSYRIHRYRYVRVDTRKISLENNPVAHITAPGTSQEVNRTQRSDKLKNKTSANVHIRW